MKDSERELLFDKLKYQYDQMVKIIIELPKDPETEQPKITRFEESKCKTCGVPLIRERKYFHTPTDPSELKKMCKKPTPT